MRKLFAWLGVATLAVLATPEIARAGDPLKPYVVLVFDTSGSMDDANSATGSGPPSCGGRDTRLDHARCAVSKIVNSYGDMVFALTRFRSNTSGTPNGNFPNGCGSDGSSAGNSGCGCAMSGAGTSGGATCNGTNSMLEVLTPLVDGNNEAANAWVNFSGNTCTASGTDPEIWNGEGNTPLAGSLVGVKDYLSGVEKTTFGRCSTTTTTSCDANNDCPNGQTCVFFTLWPNNQPGFSPIVNDPTKLAFLPKPNFPATCNPKPPTQTAGDGGCDPSASCTSNNCCCLEQCRPYITILLTDGDETCVAFDPNVTNAATSLLTTVVEGRTYRVQTKAIGFGKTPGDSEIEAIAHAGGAVNVTQPVDLNEGFYAQNETDLQLAISSILDDAIKTEKCNGRDDDCDSAIDEDFEPAKDSACDNGAIGQCRRTGTLVCNNAQTGLTCNAEQRSCVNNQLFINGTGQGANTCGELCNLLDDDCDGKIDEGIVGCSCSPQQEQCNGRDDDCDGRIDEASTNGPLITRPCGTGTCGGVETCHFLDVCGPPPGSPPGCDGFNGCTAQPSTTETCNGLDDNCDGIKDGLQAECSDMNPLPPNNFPKDDPRNNPGHPDNDPIPENICHPGFKVCPVVANPPNSFGACQNEVKPCNSNANNTPDSCQDSCNGLDDDCDNLIDEDFQSADCSNGCGIGTTACENGVLKCNSTAVPGGDNNCNGVDEDCDGTIDEGFACDDATPKPGFPATCDPHPATCDPSPTCTGNNCCCACSCTGANICNGEQICSNGTKLCQGDPVSQESCDCSDNNCNGQTDEGNLCASGSICNQFCQCAFSCASGEFPCPLGKFCKTETEKCSTAASCDPSDACTQNPNNENCCCRSLCIADPCFGVTCDPVGGVKQVCQVNAAGNAFQCVPACDVAGCTDPLICIPETGECKPNDCTTFPDRCADNQNCIAGVCVTNLCKDVTCPTDQYCAGGNCVESCADVDCPSGQRCKLGVCEDDPCGSPCPFGQACNDNSGQCVPNGCGTINCPQGQWCNPNNNGGTCETDLCVGTMCPEADQICLGGSCYDPTDLGPDGGIETKVTAGGGGGCSTGGDASLLLIGIALLFVRRRSASGGAQ